MEKAQQFVVFAGGKLVAEGDAEVVLPELKRRFDRAPEQHVHVFDLATGRALDFDLRGTLDEVLARSRTSAPRGPGRPKLGVTGREIALLPRHWAWLEEQPQGISAALRRLVEEAMKKAPGLEYARRLRASTSYILTALAGDLPHYEEATRALFADDGEKLERLVADWPLDVRDFALRQARAAAAAAQGGEPRG